MTGPKTRLKSYRARPQRLSAFGAGYSRFVRAAKIVLPLIALALMGVVFARLSQDPRQSQLSVLPEAAEQKKTVPGQVEMAGARYEGADAEGRRYTLTAAQAARDMNAEQAVLLEKPEADLALPDGGWISARAAKGRFDNKASKLFLSGGVAVFHDSGYEMHLQDVAIDLVSRHAVSRNPVKGQGPLGTLEAANVDILRQGELVVFGGPAKLTLRVAAKKDRG